MSWTSPEPAPVDEPLTGDERRMLQGVLDEQRATLLRVCAGLRPDQLAARAVPPSALSLLGLVRHMAKVERIWLRQRVGGQDVPALHGGPGDPADFADAAPEGAERDVVALVEEWRLADEAVVGVPSTREIDLRGSPMSLRRVLLHLIAEYARHNGHADLLREALDGVTGR